MIASRFTLRKRTGATFAGSCIDHDSQTVEQHVYGLLNVYGSTLLTVIVADRVVYGGGQ